MNAQKLEWQSKVILCIVVVPVALNVAWDVHFWNGYAPEVNLWNLGACVLLGLAAWISHAATPAAAATGALICASLMFFTYDDFAYPWQTMLVPVLTVLVLTSLATAFGRKRKDQLGTAEKRRGRNMAQVCANLGFAALITVFEIGSRPWGSMSPANPYGFAGALASFFLAVPALAVLAEAAADTVSSEIGQVLGGQPLMITTLKRVEPGTDGAVSLAGTIAGILAACIVALAGILMFDWSKAQELRYSLGTFLVISAGGVFGLFFDSMLGATVERKGWLNNDAVNFLSTATAAVFAVALEVALRMY